MMIWGRKKCSSCPWARGDTYTFFLIHPFLTDLGEKGQKTPIIMLNPISFLVSVNNIENADTLGSAEVKFPKIITLDEIVV